MEATELHLVDVRKYGLDASTPWWERWFFRAVYLPFVRFAFKYLHIPAQGTYHPDGSFSWVENIGIAVDEETAQAMCKGEFYRVSALPLNGELPEESLQYKGHAYPEAKNPRRYESKVFQLTAVRRREVDMLKQVDRKVDNLLNAARAG